MSKIEKYKLKIEDGYFLGKENLNIYYKKYIVENNKASIVVCHGFCESLERYEELIEVFTNNGFSVYILDNRGHGRSCRLGIDDSQIDVEKFEYYVEDLKIYIDNIVTPNNNKKLFLYAHSMGGAIGAMFLEKYNNYFDFAILDSPMMEIDTGKYPIWFAKLLAKILCIFNQGKRYVLGHGPFTGKPNLDASGTSCYKRYINYFNKQLQYKELQTSGASYHWLNEAFKAMKYIISKENACKINIELVLFQAGKDHFVNSRGQNKFADNVKKCKIIKYEEAKHEIYLERDEIFDKYIEEVLQIYNSKI